MRIKRALFFLITMGLFIAPYAESGACIEGNCDNGKGVWIWDDGNRYEGQFKNGLAHGQGTTTYKDGSWYKGQFKKDTFDEQGTYVDSEGNRYEGQFSDGLAHGKGTSTKANGAWYKGQFKKDTFDGQGTYVDFEGNRYEGQFKNGELNGFGIEYAKNGDRYKGHWVGDKKNGLGILYAANGDVLKKGYWEDDKFKYSTEVVVAESDTKRGATLLENEGLIVKPGEYHALLIGVKDYQDQNITDLVHPLKDVKKLKNILSTYYTFKSENITKLQNPTRSEITDELDRFSDELSDSDNFLIFYAGHGLWDEQFKQGYWFPTDAKKKKRSSWISNSSIRDYINGIKTNHTLLISDACFSGGIF